MNMIPLLERADHRMIGWMNRWGMTILRVALGVVFLWFGALKISGQSPVVHFIELTMPWIASRSFILVLGVWEVMIGVGLLTNHFMRFTLAILWLQMAGTLATIVTAPHILFSNSNPFLLTLEGEFVVKNVVLIAASLVIGGFAVLPLDHCEESGGAILALKR